jgi:hypothetical protein
MHRGWVGSKFYMLKLLFELVSAAATAATTANAGPARLQVPATAAGASHADQHVLAAAAASKGVCPSETAVARGSPYSWPSSRTR